MVNSDILKQITARIDSYRDEMIKMQMDLIAIPALGPESGGDGENEKAAFIVEYLKNNGFNDIREFNAPDERVSPGVRPNVIAKVPGKRRKVTVWLLTHMDIVPPGELNLWHGDPYRGYVKDGKIYGRGAEDNQQDLVASLFAARSFIDEGITPESSIGLGFVSDEETGSAKGLGYLIENHGDLFKKSDIIVVPDFGNDEGSAIEVAEKSILWLRFRTAGKQCHASRPALGRNAFAAASHLVVALKKLSTVFDDTNPIYYPPESTFEPTKKEANIPNINTIPGDDVFYLDCRVLPSYNLNDIVATIRSTADDIAKRFDVAIEITPIQRIQAPPPTPSDAPVVGALQEAIRDIYGVDASAVGIGGGTVAAYFRKKGIPVAVWSRLCEMAHQPNEYCRIDNMIRNAQIFAYLCLRK